MPGKKENNDEQDSVIETENLTAQPCPICHESTLSLNESETEVPYFGKVYLFSMTCSNCKYHKADVEAEEQKEPCKYTIEISGEQDLSIRVVKSSQATVKIPHIMSIEPGPASSGYVTNIEGIINRVKYMLEDARDNEEEEENRKKAKNMLKKIQRALFGQESLKIIIEDPSGNSAIISEKAERKKL